MQFTTASLALACLGFGAAMVPQNIVARDTPSYCKPLDKVDQFNDYSTYDESDSCAETADCVNSCGTFITSGAQPGLTDQIKNDLLLAMGQQVTKDGQFEISKVGGWTASFPLGITAVHNRNIVGEWSLAVNGYAAANTVIPVTVYLQATGDSYFDVVYVTYTG
jgi:hypothetical protein